MCRAKNRLLSKHYAPEPNPYALNRYDFEAWRHWKILDTHLADRQLMVSGRYALLDMTVWGWAPGPSTPGLHPTPLRKIQRLRDRIKAA